MKQDEKKKQKSKNTTIYQKNENCQVFSGPISGCVFAMPGATVHQSPVQQVKGEPDIQKDSQDEMCVCPDCEEVPEVISEESSSLIDKCFKFNNAFVKDTVNAVVKSFYNGSHADLALIEVSLFDHGQLRKRNAHKAFVKSLIAWGILDKVDEEELKQIQKGIIDKFRHLPKDGYMEWGDSLLNDKNTCISIGKKLGPTMKYCR